MKTADSSIIWPSGAAETGIDELRQEGQEEDRQFRIEDVEQGSRHGDARQAARLVTRLDLQRAAIANGLPCEPEQIGDAGEFYRLEGQRAGMQDRRDAEDRGQHVRHNAERAAKCRRDAGEPAPRKRHGQRVDDAGAGREDDDERGDKKFR